MGPEVKDHVSLQWPSYEQPQGSNLRAQRNSPATFEPLYDGFGVSAMWAVLTAAVVVVFEFSAGTYVLITMTFIYFMTRSFLF
jgi:hypothetical protein